MSEKESRQDDRKKERGMEIKGQQLRFRVVAPVTPGGRNRFESYYTINLRKGGAVQKLMGVDRFGEREAQSYRINLSKTNRSKAKRAIEVFPTRGDEKEQAFKLIDGWYDQI